MHILMNLNTSDTALTLNTSRTCGQGQHIEGQGPGYLDIREGKVLVAELCATLCNSMDVAFQASLSMEFSRQEFWSG